MSKLSVTVPAELLERLRAIAAQKEITLEESALEAFAEYAETWELFFKYSPGGADSFRLHELVIIVDQSLAVAHAWLINHEPHSSPWPNPREPARPSRAVRVVTTCAARSPWARRRDSPPERRRRRSLPRR